MKKIMNAIYRFAAKRFIPNDNETELAEALYNWKYRK